MISFTEYYLKVLTVYVNWVKSLTTNLKEEIDSSLVTNPSQLYRFAAFFMYPFKQLRHIYFVT